MTKSQDQSQDEGLREVMIKRKRLNGGQDQSQDKRLREVKKKMLNGSQDQSRDKGLKGENQKNKAKLAVRILGRPLLETEAINQNQDFNVRKGMWEAFAENEIKIMKEDREVIVEIVEIDTDKEDREIIDIGEKDHQGDELPHEELDHSLIAEKDLNLLVWKNCQNMMKKM